MEIQGMDGTITADAHGVTLYFKGLSTHPDKKKVSPRHIPWTAITGIQFHAPNGLRSGYVRVVVSGESAAIPKPNRDVNALMINFGGQADAARLFADQLSDRLGSRPGAAPAQPYSPGSQAATVRDAKERMGVKVGARRELRKLKQHLLPGEQVRYLAAGVVNRRQGLVALTDRRLLVLFHGVVRQSIEDLPLDRITSTKEKAGVLMGTLTVLASNTTLVVTNISKVDMKALSKALRARLTTGSLPPLPALELPDASAAMDDEASVTDVPAANDSALDQLARLGELHLSGVLRDDEFTDAKAQILGRL